VAGFGGRFAAVFGVFVGVAVTRGAGDEAASAAEAAGGRVGSAALDAADAAILRVVGEYGFAIVAGVTVAVSGAGCAILEAARAIGLGGIERLGFGVFVGAIGGGRHWDSRSAASPTDEEPNAGQYAEQGRSGLHPRLTPRLPRVLGWSREIREIREIREVNFACVFSYGAGVGWCS